MTAIKDRNRVSASVTGVTFRGNSKTAILNNLEISEFCMSYSMPVEAPTSGFRPAHDYPLAAELNLVLELMSCPLRVETT